MEHDEGDTRPGPTARRGTARPPTVLVCETSAGALVLHGMPDGPVACLEPGDAVDLRHALDAAFRRVGAAPEQAAVVDAFRPGDWFAARPGDRPIDRWEADVPADVPADVATEAADGGADGPARAPAGGPAEAPADVTTGER